MLIHHFEAKTRGFQGLVDQNDGGKALVPEKSILHKKNFCGGLIFQGLRLSLRHFGQQAPESPVSAPKWSNIFSTSFHCGLIDI